jgi:hypothetical protein
MNAPLRQRQPRYTNRRLLDLCHNEDCYLSITGCVGVNPEQPSVPCHSNWQEDGKGVGEKSDDDSAVPGCPPCHWQLDHGTMLTTEQKREVFREAQRRWWRHLWRTGKIRVA